MIPSKTNLNFFRNYLFFRFCYFILSNNSLLDSKILPKKNKYPLHLKNLKLRNYNFLKPSKVSNIRIKKWLSNNFDEKKILTFTMRNSPYQKYRNSNLRNWIRLKDYHKLINL